MVEIRKNKEKIISEIIKCDKIIKFLYDFMDSDNKDVFEDNIKVQIEKENKLLEMLNVTKGNSEKIYQVFKECLDDSILEKNLFEIKDDYYNSILEVYYGSTVTNENTLLNNDLILKRFESYLYKKFMSNPIVSKDKIENNAVISYQIDLDLNSSTVYFLNELEEKSNSKKEIEKTILERNKILFVNKQLEENYMSNNLEINGCKKCLENNHDRKMVTDIFNKIVSDNTEEKGSRCFLFLNHDFENEEKTIQFNITLQKFKGGLNLLTLDDLKDAYMIYKTKYIQTQRNSIKNMSKGIKEVIEIKSRTDTNTNTTNTQKTKK